MWNMDETRQLTVEQPSATWMNPDLVVFAGKIAAALRITGSQTLTSRAPSDDANNYLGFTAILNSTLATGVQTQYVLEDNESVAQRPSSIAEALAELAHSAGFGDRSDEAKLHALVGDAKARALMKAATVLL